MSKLTHMKYTIFTNNVMMTNNMASTSLCKLFIQVHNFQDINYIIVQYEE